MPRYSFKEKQEFKKRQKSYNPNKANSPVFGERHPDNLGIKKSKLKGKDKDLQKRYDKLKQEGKI